MEFVTRYDKRSVVSTSLDPIQDVLCWIGGLRSRGYVEKILKEVHGYKTKHSIESRAASISRHAQVAIDLLNQGLSGPVETSFLPVYYGLLNLSKIYIICSKNYGGLRRKSNRQHGAFISPHRGNPKTFMKDKVLLMKRGTIPLLYKTLTGLGIPSEKYVVELKDVYPYIVNISFEYNFLHGENRLQPCLFELNRDDVNGHFLNMSFRGDKYNGFKNKGVNQVLRGLSRVENDNFNSARTMDPFEQVFNQLRNSIPRFLIYDYLDNGKYFSYVPLSGKQLLFPEEIPIILAFFHLSNIVRYNPDLLFELMDSQNWSMIQALSRHGAFRFMTLFWSYFQQTTVSFAY